MSLWQKFKLLWSVVRLYGEVGNVKAGWKTTEFWMTILTSLSAMVGQFEGAVPAPWGTILAAVVTAAYAIARALTKAAAPK